MGVKFPQKSVAVAVPKAASIVAALGLQPMFPLLTMEPVAVMVGTVRSKVQLMVREALAVLLHASIAVHDLV